MEGPSNIGLGVMSRPDKRPRLTDDNQNILHGEVYFGQNFDVLGSSSFGQVTSVTDELAPIADDLTLNMFENDFNLPFVGEDDAHSESEQPDVHAQPSKGKRGKKRKNYQRHTPEQIQGMEAFFKQCPHPDEKQRKALGLQIGLDNLQVKFWFQNKRTQIKAQHERRESNQLRAENERLRAENKQLMECLPLSTCKICGKGCTVLVHEDENLLRMENQRLREKIEHIRAIAKHVFGDNIPDSFLESPEIGVILDNIQSGGITAGGSKSCGLLNGLSDLDRSLITEIANSAMDEVAIMARIGEPIWIPNFERNTAVLNEQEYLKFFHRSSAPQRVGYKSEASRECAVVMMNPRNIIEIFMELNKWLAVFSGVVSKAMLLELIPTNAEGAHDGFMQVLSAEFQVLSPAVPTRDCFFVRCCKQINEGMWAIVDVSVDDILQRGPTARCQKRPSGCIVQALPNGCSQITWIEHVEVQDFLIHTISNSFINSGEAYGAKRWISILRRQCERLASAMGRADFPYYKDHTEMVLAHPQGRRNVLKLAERMVLSFCGNVTASTSAYHWTKISGDGVDEARIMTRKSCNDPGRPSGLVLGASLCFWIPVLPRTVFEYLRNDKTRAQWDILSIGGGVKEIAYIGNGDETGNCVSVLRVTGPYTDQGNVLLLQESSCESTTSYVVYAPVDILSANKLFKGGNPEHIKLLPSGFTILPNGPPCLEGALDDATAAGSLVSIAFQILVDSDPFAKLSVASVATVNNLIEATMEKIKAALVPYCS